MAQNAMLRVARPRRRHAFVRGVRGMLPQNFFLKMVHFGVYLLQFCQKKIVKMLIFYTKVIDIVLLRTIYRGIRAYSPECLLCNYCAIWCVLEYMLIIYALFKY